MTRHPTNTELVSTIQILPNELIAEVLYRVVQTSVADMFNAKLSCKTMNEVGEDSQVYQNVTLEKFPVIPWYPLTQKQEAFLIKCRECGNPELMYRQAVIDYFNTTNIAASISNLDKAVKLGHLEALYFTCIVLLLSGDSKLKHKGIKLMGNMKRSKSSNGNFRSCRNKLIGMLEKIWVKNPVLKQRPVCCAMMHHHLKKSHYWPDDDEM